MRRRPGGRMRPPAGARMRAPDPCSLATYTAEQMTSDDIRRTYLEFFEQRDHRRLPSASLMPAELDPSALFTIAGMHPLKPYFLGAERAPHPRATSCQKTFRTADIEIIGTTTRHLTFFEMLGNFSFGDYFKREAARFAWELSVQGFGFKSDEMWITVFGGENERFLEYWNLVFMQFNQQPANVLSPLPAKNIDTGLGLNRLASILQDKPSIFETDQFWPLIELGQELSGSRYGDDENTDQALRVLADHARAMTFLIADGVVPSNEDRGYVLRRIIRR